MISVFIKELKNIAKNPWYDPPLFPVISPTHRISLATASLPIRKYGSIVPFKTVVNDRLGQILKNFLLTAFLLKHVTEAILILLFG
jgi:hypothetical protein